MAGPDPLPHEVFTLTQSDHPAGSAIANPRSVLRPSGTSLLSFISSASAT
jgi:hypothetical protein